MTDKLLAVHDREAQLMATLPEHGFIEERMPIIEGSGVSTQWVFVLNDYVGLLKDPSCHEEALRRAVFLVWDFWNEPEFLTGMGDHSPQLERRTLEALEAELLSPDPEPELLSMLGGYGPGLPFDLHPEFQRTLAVLKTLDGVNPAFPFLNSDVRGSMGAYWLSRNDLPPGSHPAAPKI